MADLFAEADEALRREKMAKLWAENKLYIIGFIVGTIVLTGVFSTYKSWDEGVREKQTAQVIALQSAADYPENILKTEKLDLRPGLRAITLLSAAGKFMSQKEAANALTLYERAANDNALPSEFSELATLMVVRLKENEENANADELLSTLKTIYKNDNNPYAAHAKLEAAVIQANLNKDYDAAHSLLNELQDTTALPQSLYEKARFLDHIYSLRQAKEKPANEKTENKQSDDKS